MNALSRKQATVFETNLDTVYGRMEVHTCVTCSVTWAAPKTLYALRRKDGNSAYCPNGHSFSWTPGPSEEEQLRSQLEQEKERRARLASQVEQERAHSRALKGVVTKTKKKLASFEQRVAHGVCPCCNRTFKQLDRHMQSKHPEYVEEPR